MMKSKVLAFLLAISSFSLFAQSKSEVIKNINDLLQHVKNVRLMTSESSPTHITHTYMNFSAHSSKKGWVSLTSVTSWGSGYENLTLTYSFDPTKIEEISLNDELDKKRGNKAFLFALTLDDNSVDITSVQGGKTSRDQSDMVVMYIMMKGDDGYEIYDTLEELFQELVEVS
ncbi:hypothetical protein SF1_32820 [Sphingobacterium faecium NBRC 15299]|uniref:hypothetical protein n=1 Tax=Sphingobacterium faecium TaxID=34087 RepID=UPI00119710CE|nr:hypothetical protein [Sphingobacterium faecium]GEM65300.1 hypothetical protein SF1_32820 [Sphingobacterium faecium NBRC 15299]